MADTFNPQNGSYVDYYINNSPFFPSTNTASANQPVTPSEPSTPAPSSSFSELAPELGFRTPEDIDRYVGLFPEGPTRDQARTSLVTALMNRKFGDDSLERQLKAADLYMGRHLATIKNMANEEDARRRAAFEARRPGDMALKFFESAMNGTKGFQWTPPPVLQMAQTQAPFVPFFLKSNSKLSNGINVPNGMNIG